ncbi:hypothetical protein GWK47_014109 [Chionoecetes opilio]|uniref:RNase H type-1 domain-containing protein n=1 Tax=Chionoecetes opilio TaxID=41210 RepID=A0A8J4XUY8_CHIOP|nr:hypothetical protein GWK47_014109 [Chionoecetes opilio]
MNSCETQGRHKRGSPWHNTQVTIIISPLDKKKHMYAPHELKYIVLEKLSPFWQANSTHVWCDGSVMESGRAGCGILVRQYDVHGVVTDTHHAYRLSDAISSTQAELSAILLGLGKVKDGVGDTFLYVDSRGALESLRSPHHVFEEIVNECMGILQGIERTGRSVTFIWVPSHVGITLNERVDDIAKQATCRDSVDIQGTLSMRQVKTQIRDTQNDTDKARMENKYANHPLMAHYTNVALQTHFSYGKHRTKWKDTVFTRLRLGSPFYWELGMNVPEDDKKCRLCQQLRSYTLQHYILQCPSLATFRHPDIDNVTDQVIWMTNNGQVDAALRKTSLQCLMGSG